MPPPRTARQSASPAAWNVRDQLGVWTRSPAGSLGQRSTIAAHTRTASGWGGHLSLSQRSSYSSAAQPSKQHAWPDDRRGLPRDAHRHAAPGTALDPFARHKLRRRRSLCDTPPGRTTGAAAPRSRPPCSARRRLSARKSGPAWPFWSAGSAPRAGRLPASAAPAAASAAAGFGKSQLSDLKISRLCNTCRKVASLCSASGCVCGGRGITISKTLIQVYVFVRWMRATYKNVVSFCSASVCDGRVYRSQYSVFLLC